MDNTPLASTVIGEIVAIANKLARIAWAVLFRGKAYEHSQVCAQA
jgi:hypothetical protein